MAHESRTRAGAPTQERITLPLLQTLAEFLNTSEELGGAEIVSNTGLPVGTVYPLIARLRNKGWLEASFEHVDANKKSRPPRRLYRLTSKGRTRAASLVRRELKTVFKLSSKLVDEPATR